MVLSAWSRGGACWLPTGRLLSGMSRPVRIHLPKATYLVQLRARPNVDFFPHPNDRTLFLQSLGEAVQPVGARVYAFALMRNSVLLFLRSGEVPLSGAIHRVQAAYLNRQRAQNGSTHPILQDRHRSILVEEGELFRDVVRRVHIAPIIGGHWSNESEARRWGEVSTSRWTSFPLYTGRSDVPEWFDRDGVLERFRDLHPTKPEEGFYRFVIEGVKRREGDILDRVVAMSLLGSDDFVNQYRARAKGNRRTHGATANPDLHAERIETITRLVADAFGVTSDTLLKPRSRHLARKVFVELALKHALHAGGVRELADHLQVTGSALAHMRRDFRSQLENDADLRELIERLEARLG